MIPLRAAYIAQLLTLPDRVQARLADADEPWERAALERLLPLAFRIVRDLKLADTYGLEVLRLPSEFTEVAMALHRDYWRRGLSHLCALLDPP